MSFQYINDNMDAWDKRTGVHLESEFYDVKGFLNGKNSLKNPELELCKLIKGQRLLHLQCHFGLDTLSWARLGAEVIGVDFSSDAIDAANRLKIESGLNASFIQADVQQLGKTFKNSADIVITTYGVLCWLENLDYWAQSIRKNLKLGGKFILVEFHPFLDIYYNGAVSGCSSYFNDLSPISGKSVGTYTDREAPIAYNEHRWQHPISEVTNALIHAGLKILDFQEYPYCSYPIVSNLSEQEHGMWYPPNSLLSLPFMYSIVAEVSRD